MPDDEQAFFSIPVTIRSKKKRKKTTVFLSYCSGLTTVGMMAMYYVRTECLLYPFLFYFFLLFIFSLFEQKVKRPLSALKLSTSFRIAVQPSVARDRVEQPSGWLGFWAVTKTLMSPCSRRILQLAKSHQSAGHL